MLSLDVQAVWRIAGRLYWFQEEMPIFLMIFLLPALVAVFVNLGMNKAIMDKRLEAFSDGIIAYLILQQLIIASQGTDSLLKKTVGNDYKGKLSPVFYMIAIAAAFWSQWISQAPYVLMAAVWLVPDRRIENALIDKET